MVVMKLMVRRSAVRNSDIGVLPTRLIAHLENEVSHAKNRSASAFSRAFLNHKTNLLHRTNAIKNNDLGRFGFVGTPVGSDFLSRPTEAVFGGGVGRRSKRCHRPSTR
jgi:hypothetical protein